MVLRRPMFSRRLPAQTREAVDRWAAAQSRTLGRRRHNQALAGGMERLRQRKADY
jgi:hypothetical protein